MRISWAYDREFVEVLGKAVVEAGGDDGLVGGGVVSSAVVSDGAGFAANGETHSKRPDEHPDIDITVPFDDPALACAVVDELRWEHRSQQRPNCVWGELHLDHSLHLILP